MKIIVDEKAKERLIQSIVSHIITKATQAAKEGRKTFIIKDFSNNDYYAEVIQRVKSTSEGTVVKYDNLINGKFKIVKV